MCQGKYNSPAMSRAARSASNKQVVVIVAAAAVAVVVCCSGCSSISSCSSQQYSAVGSCCCYCAGTREQRRGGAFFGHAPCTCLGGRRPQTRMAEVCTGTTWSTSYSSIQSCYQPCYDLIPISPMLLSAWPPPRGIGLSAVTQNEGSTRVNQYTEEAYPALRPQQPLKVASLTLSPSALLDGKVDATVWAADSLKILQQVLHLG